MQAKRGRFWGRLRKSVKFLIRFKLIYSWSRARCSVIAISIDTMTCVLLNKFNLSIFIFLCVIRTYTIWWLNNVAKARKLVYSLLCAIFGRDAGISIIALSQWSRRQQKYLDLFFSAEHLNARFDRTMANANFILDEIVAMIITAPVDSWYCMTVRLIACPCTSACERRKCHSFASMWSIRKPMGGNEVSSRECEPIFMRITFELNHGHCQFSLFFAAHHSQSSIFTRLKSKTIGKSARGTRFQINKKYFHNRIGDLNSMSNQKKRDKKFKNRKSRPTRSMSRYRMKVVASVLHWFGSSQVKRFPTEQWKEIQIANQLQAAVSEMNEKKSWNRFSFRGDERSNAK